MPATAIIQFIGIMVFTKQLSADGHLQVYMPRLTGHRQMTITGVNAATGAEIHTTTTTQHGAIEEHVAVIVFPATDYRNESSWKAQPYPLNNALSYVQLDGDEVTIRSDLATSSLPATGTSLRTFTVTDAEAVPELPRLKKRCCQAMGALTPHDPEAVINLPPLPAHACARPDNLGHIPRVDTHMRVPTQAALIISAHKLGNPSQERQLRLRADAHVMIAHIPKWTLTSTSRPSIYTFGDSQEHYMAYYSMTDAPNACTSFGCAVRNVKDVCEWIGVGDVINKPHPDDIKPYTGHQIDSLVDFQCSNSQYP